MSSLQPWHDQLYWGIKSYFISLRKTCASCIWKASHKALDFPIWGCDPMSHLASIIVIGNSTQVTWHRNTSVPHAEESWNISIMWSDSSKMPTQSKPQTHFSILLTISSSKSRDDKKSFPQHDVDPTATQQLPTKDQRKDRSIETCYSQYLCYCSGVIVAGQILKPPSSI